jgi:hypothetical protein
MRQLRIRPQRRQVSIGPMVTPHSMCESITDISPVPASTCTSATWEKLPGKSLPRAISAEVATAPRETRISPLCSVTPRTTAAGVAEGSSSPASRAGS